MNPRHKFALGIVAGLLFSCNAMAEEENQPLTCPSTNFHQFLDAFTETEAIQRAFTNVPLKVQRIENNENLTQVLYWETDVKFPLFPSHQEREKRTLEINLLELTEYQAKVALVAPDTDWLVHYHFNKDTCWKLTFVDDQSL